jgi:hypothetical protein
MSVVEEEQTASDAEEEEEEEPLYDLVLVKQVYNGIYIEREIQIPRIQPGEHQQQQLQQRLADVSAYLEIVAKEIN